MTRERREVEGGEEGKTERGFVMFGNSQVEEKSTAQAICARPLATFSAEMPQGTPVSGLIWDIETSLKVSHHPNVEH